MTKCINPKKMTSSIVGLALIACSAQIARADVIPYPDIGTPNPVAYNFTAAATGDVTAYFAGSAAGYDEQLGMLDNGVLTAAGFGLDDHTSSLGQSFDLGQVTAGDTLTFVVKILSPFVGYVYSDPALNTSYDTSDVDGHNHVYSASYTATSPIIAPNIPAGTYVAFEDLPFPGSDFNYFDETYVFTDVGVTTSDVPEPASLALLGIGLLSIVAIRRFKSSRSLAVS